jgi:hypothetical protein
VGFAPLPRIETKNLTDYAFLTIRQIRTKAWVATRLEHANRSIRVRSTNHDSRPARRGGARRVATISTSLPSNTRKSDESVERESRQSAADKSRHFRLVDLERLWRRGLSQTTLSYERTDLPGQFRVGERLGRPVRGLKHVLARSDSLIPSLVCLKPVPATSTITV